MTQQAYRPLISVIVPVYKVQAYLDRCVKSIVAQTYENLQIILVDDGSPDACPIKCDAWAKRDERVLVIHKKNGGLGSARNAGLEIASGKLVSFIDSDDWIAPSFYEKLYAVLTEHDADIAECNWVQCHKFPCEVECNQTDAVCAVTPQEAISQLMHDGKFRQVAWNKLYRRSTIEGIDFPEVRAHEDEGWTYRAFGNAKKLVKLDAFLYFYFQNDESIMHKSWSPVRLYSMVAKEERAAYIKERFPKLYPQALLCVANSYMGAYQTLCTNADMDEGMHIRNQIHGKFKALDFSVFKALQPLKHRAWNSAFACAPQITARVRNKFKIGF